MTNVAAFVFALAGAGLSLFQPVVLGFSHWDFLFLSYNENLIKCVINILAVSIIAVIYGVTALKRKWEMKNWKNNPILGFMLCASELLIVGYFLIETMPEPVNWRERDLVGILTEQWWRRAVFWALCYVIAACCAYLDYKNVISQSSGSVSESAFVKFPSAPAAPKTFEPVLGVETPALIRRGKIFLSDDDFDEAERYFEQALRQNPENSQAYLGRLMAELRVHSTDELSSVNSSLSEMKLFKRALEFADDDEKTALMKCLEENAKNFDANKKVYDKVLREIDKLTSLAQAQRVIKILESLVPYKDTEELIRRVKEKAAAFEALAKKYNDAVQAQEYGNANRDIDSLKRAEKMFKELGSYRDSRTLAETVRRQIDERISFM